MAVFVFAHSLREGCSDLQYKRSELRCASNVQHARFETPRRSCKWRARLAATCHLPCRIGLSDRLISTMQPLRTAWRCAGLVSTCSLVGSSHWLVLADCGPKFHDRAWRQSTRSHILIMPACMAAAESYFSIHDWLLSCLYSIVLGSRVACADTRLTKMSGTRA